MTDGSLVSVPGRQLEPVQERPCKSEWVWLLILLGSLFALQLFTHRFYPVVWCDEVSFSEPAINFVKHGSFTTTVWQHQPPDTFPAINCPLYSMALVPWLTVTGTNLLAVRSFNHALMTLAAFLIWAISWKYKLVQSKGWRLLLLVLIFAGYGMSFAYRCSRPDVLALVILGLLVLSPSLKREWLRITSICLLGAACIWVGLQVALYAALVSFFAWAFLRVISWKTVLALALGFCVGVVTLGIFMEAQGVLKYLMPIVLGMSGKHYAHAEGVSFIAGVMKVVKKTVFAYPDDFSTVILVSASLVLLRVCWRMIAQERRAWVITSLVLIAAVPAVFNIVGHYAFYYSYMLFVPAVLGFATLASAGNGIQCGPWARVIVIVAFGAAVIVGLPLRLGLALGFGRFDSSERIKQIVSTNLRANDVVFTEYLAFFEVKRVARRVYDPWSSAETLPFHIPGRSFSAAEKSEISALVVRPEQLEHYQKIFGGSWVEAGPPFGDLNDREKIQKAPLVGSWLLRHLTQPQTDRFQVQIFRRAETSIAVD